MKNLKWLLSCALCASLFVACDNKDEHQYIDLNTGKHVNLVKDSVSGIMVNAETREPVRIYYDTKSKDTIWGKTGVVINNKVIRSSDGKYDYADADGDGETKIKDDEFKQKTDDGDSKTKVGDDYKKKVENDGDVKIKDGDTKVKIEDGERKVKKDD